MNSYQTQILNAVDTQTQTGNAVWVGQVCQASFIPHFGDSSAVGTVQIQASNDKPMGAQGPGYVPGASTWANIPNATSAVTSGVGPAIVIPQMSFAYIRAVFTYTSGGTTTVMVDMSAMIES